MSEVELFIQENIWTLYGIFLAILFTIVIYNLLKGRGKIMVRVKTPLKEEIHWKKPIVTEKGNEVVMEKTDKKKIGWTFSFSNKSLVSKKRFLGLISYFAVDVFPKATKAIEYDYEGNKAEMPLLTQKQAAQINRLDAFVRRYSRVEQPKSTWIQYITLILSIIILIFIFLLMKGIRIA